MGTIKLPPGLVLQPQKPTTKAQADYIQNGLQLPKKKENLRKVLNQVRSQGYFNKEYNYALRRKEAFEDFVRRIESELNDPDNIGDEVKRSKTLNYEPMIEGSRFEAAYQMVLNDI
ncbi:MAG TPA: hypothetical protein DCP55_07450 [Chitinophagaceae bacterium]|nr:hypothetical protein [Pseudomonadota bacterium]HAL95745.1 hypothetical protein [Chitinophagaceae bacterium]